MARTKPDEADWAARDAQICRLALSLLKNQDMAEEVAQEAWMGALTKNLMAGGKQLSAYLNVAVRNGVSKVWRDQSNRNWKDQAGARDEALPSALEDLASGECSDILRKAVGELSEPYRSAIALHFFEDMTSLEIAKHLNSNDSTVRTHLKRGLERLRQRLDGNYGRTEWTTGMLLMLNLKTGWVPGASDKLIPTTLTPVAPVAYGGVGLIASLSAAVLLLVGVPLLYFGLPGSGTKARPAFDERRASEQVPSQRADRVALASLNQLDVSGQARFAQDTREQVLPAIEVEVLEAQQASGVSLSVLDPFTQEHVRGIRIIEDGMHSYPHLQGNKAQEYLLRDVQSPVLIAPSGSDVVRSFWISADDHAWQQVKIKDPAADERTMQAVVLKPGARLEIQYEGSEALAGRELILSKPGDLEPIFSTRLDAFPLVLEGLPTGPIRIEILNGMPMGFVANGEDFFQVFAPSTPLCSQSTVLVESAENRVQLALNGPASRVPMADVTLELRLEQPLWKDKNTLSISPSSMEGYALLPSPLRLTSRIKDPKAPRSVTLYQVSLPEGNYRLGFAPLGHFQELQIVQDGYVIVAPARAEPVTIELGTSLSGMENRPETLLFSRLLSVDHYPITATAKIDWELQTCSVDLVPGRYTVKPSVDSALFADMNSVTFEVLAGESLQLPIDWQAVGLLRPQLGINIELRHGNTLVPIIEMPSLLEPIGHAGKMIPFMLAAHPYLRGPGRFPIIPINSQSSLQIAAPWTGDMRVTEPGDYLLGSVNMPPYLPTEPLVVRIEPGGFTRVILQLELR